MSETWTEDRLAILRDRWGQGEAASVIATALGVSRSAVLGKAHRLGLTARGLPVAPTGPHADARRRREGLLAWFERCAAEGEACPSNLTIAEHFGMASGSSVGRMIGDLREAGLVRVRWQVACRAVMIVATGRETALPDLPPERPAGPVWVRRISRGPAQRRVAAERARIVMEEHARRALSTLEQAKLHLQRTGRIVYAATVNGGPAGCWRVSGVARPIRADELVELAASRGFDPKSPMGASS